MYAYQQSGVNVPNQLSMHADSLFWSQITHTIRNVYYLGSKHDMCWVLCVKHAIIKTYDGVYVHGPFQWKLMI